MSGNIWSPNPDLVVQANASGTVKSESIFPTTGQRLLQLKTFAYSPGTKSLLVFKNGQYLPPGEGYFEVDPASIMLANAPVAGDEYAIVGFVGIVGNVTTDTQLRSDLANNGTGIIGYQHNVSADPTTLQNDLRAELVNVNLYFKAGEADATAMFNRATAAARRVYVPAGTYNLNSANLPSNTHIFGDGDATILKMLSTSTYVFTCDSGSNNVANNITNIKLSRLQLLATSDVDGLLEHNHLVSINGVSNAVFEEVLFRGFRGDGLYIGSSNTAATERHNENITVRKCRFDGINRSNRNAISVIDGNGILIEDNLFTNCTSPNEPGPIDVEPDPNAFGIVANITVRNNKFINNGGNVAEVAVLVPAAVTAQPYNITVENNSSLNYQGTGSFFYFNDGRNATTTSTVNNTKLIRNYVKSSNGKAFFIASGRRHTIEGNTFIDCKYGSFISYTDNTVNVVRDIEVVRNRFERSGYVDGNGLSLFNVNYCNIEKNKFIDCGAGVAGSANAIDCNNGTSSYITIDNNEFSTPTGKTQIAVQKEASHTFTPATNKYVGNIAAGLNNWFVAEESDTLEQSFTPTVTGSGVNGAGAASNTWAVYRRIGKTVFFKIKTTIAAGHTGTGMIQVSLPTTVAATPNNQETLVNLTVDGAATTGGQLGLINPALVVNGLGAIRCYYQGTGTLSQMTIPAGAFTVYASGSYQVP